MQGVEDEKETVYCLTMILRFNHEWIPHLTFVARFPRLTSRSSKMNDLRTTMTPKSSAASLSVFGSLQEATAKNSRIQLVPLEQTNEAHERHDSATLHDFSLFASWSFTSNFCAKMVEVLLLLADAGDLHKFESIDFKYISVLTVQTPKTFLYIFAI